MAPVFSGTPGDAVPGALVPGLPASPGTQNIAVVNEWTASRQINGPGFGYGKPQIGSVDCAVASSAGNWLIAFCSWTLPGAAWLGCTMAVADDTHGYWIPLGIPNGDTAATGYTRCSIWARPGGGPSNQVPGAKHVYVAPQGLPGPVYPSVIGITVIEVTGMSPYAGIPALVPASANGVTSIAANAAAPAGQALMVTVAASDSGALTGPGGTWSALTGVSVSAGAPIILHTSPAWQVSSAARTASWTASTSDLSACTATILVSNAAPAQPNPNWPSTSLQVGFGSGALTPPSQITWTDITPRLLSGHEDSSTRGKQYELDQTQAGTITCTLDNNDGALTPGLASSPYYPNVLADVPVRLLMTWEGRTYSAWYGYVERWPQTWDGGTRFGLSEITVTDSWSLLNAPLTACQQEQILLNSPYAYWTLGDAEGSSYAQNSAPGNTSALLQVTSKFGAGNATAAFGAASGVNSGDPSGTAWQQTGLTEYGYGYCLHCADANFPSLASGITIMGWFDPAAASFTEWSTTGTNANPCVFTVNSGAGIANGDVVSLITASGFTLPAGFSSNTQYYVVNASSTTYQLSQYQGGTGIGSTASGAGYVAIIAGQPVGDIILARGTNSAGGPMFEMALESAYGGLPGQLYLKTWDKVTHAATTTVVNSGNWMGGHSHFTLAISQTGWQVYVDGGGATGASGSCNLGPVMSWVSFLGSADRYLTGNMANAEADHIALFAGILTPDQISQIVIAGYPVGGEFATEPPSTRIERLMAYGGWSGPRAISTGSATEMAGISDIQGTTGSVSADGIVTAANGQQAGEAVTNIVTSDGGWMFSDGNGVMCYISRGDLYGKSAMWLLGEDSGEYPYYIDVSMGYDKQLLYNEAQLTQSTGTGTPVSAQNDASALQHGVSAYTQTVYQYDIGVVADQANWIVYTRSTPAERAESLSVNAAPNATNWPFVLGVEPAQPVQVARRPILASGPVVVRAIVAQVKRAFDFKSNVATASIVTDAFPEGQVLIADDPVFGQLTGSNVLPW